MIGVVGTHFRGWNGWDLWDSWDLCDREGFPLITNHQSLPTTHFSLLTSHGANVHLDRGDAFSSGDFFAGVAGEFQKAE